MNRLFKYILFCWMLLPCGFLFAQEEAQQEYEYEEIQEPVEEYEYDEQEVYEVEDYEPVDYYPNEEVNDKVTDETYKYDRSYFSDDLASADFDKSDWKKATQDLDYSEDPKKPKKEKETNNADLPDFNGEILSKEAAEVLRTFFFILAIGILAFILYRILRSSVMLKNPKVRAQTVGVTEVIQNIQETELEKMLREALSSNNYKQAIRICYLMVIKELSLKKLIEWKKDKTNGEYLKEMRDHEEYRPFRDLTRFFERAWFGEGEVQEGDYTQSKPKFDSLIQTIEKIPTPK